MRTYILLAGIITLAGCGGSNNPTTQADNANNARIDSTSANNAQAAKTKKDADFLVFAANAGTFEIQAAKLANQKSSNKGVKEFADMMIKDHTDLGNKATALATQKNITLPTALSTGLQNEYNKLDSLTGKKFDEEYVDANVKGHAEVVSKFESVSTDSSYSSDIMQFAATALPTLKEHKEHAEMLQQSEKGNKKTS